MCTRNVLTILVLAGALAACPGKKKPGEPQAGPGAPAATAAAAAASDAGRSAAVGGGARIYGGNCGPPHQQKGVGISRVDPDLAGAAGGLRGPAPPGPWGVQGQK